HNIMDLTMNPVGSYRMGKFEPGDSGFVCENQKNTCDFLISICGKRKCICESPGSRFCHLHYCGHTIDCLLIQMNPPGYLRTLMSTVFAFATFSATPAIACCSIRIYLVICERQQPPTDRTRSVHFPNPQHQKNTGDTKRVLLKAITIMMNDPYNQDVPTR
ncbi:hypothetical protein ABER02_21800, partial [Rossellomorea marisflavi]|uniref:hypothetical protein n=1 Tax=Rossellomorea marisflavi TaxID=189381 RepID=UPI003D268FA9